MASEDNSGNNTDSLLQNLISPSINPPPTLFSLPEQSGVDVAIPTPSELKDRLIFGPYPHSVLIDALSQNPSSSSAATTSFSDYSAVKPKPTHHGVHRSRSAPPMAAINDITDPVDRVFHRPKSHTKSTVRQAVALLIVYLSVMSVATVLYGDQALKALPGWLLAAIWLLVSTLAVALVFLCLAKARVDQRNREWANRALAENLSLSQFFAADIDNNGYVSISEYTIYKLKQMEKVSQEDIIMIAKQFDKLDRTKSGKITLSDLL